MRRVTIDDLIAQTGTGKRTAMRLVRENKLPGFIDGRQYICSPGEFQRWRDTGEVVRHVRSTQPHSSKRTPVKLIRNVKEEVA